MLNLLTMYPRRTDVTSYYRGVGVINELTRLGNDIRITETNTLSWCELVGQDLFFLQRPFLQEHLDVLNIVKYNNKKIVIDYDDLMFEIPSENKFHQKYKDKDYPRFIKECMDVADGIIFSTDFLAKHLITNGHLSVDKKYAVINNAINNYTLKMKKKEFNYNKIVVWRGSSSHYIDFEEYGEQYETIVKTNPDFTFYFMGYAPLNFFSYNDKEEPISKKYSNTYYMASTDVMVYNERNKRLAPSLFVTPLKDFAFNRAKSNICKIEATYAGAVSLNNDFKEWVWSEDKRFLFDKETFLKQFQNCLEMIRTKDVALETEYLKNIAHINSFYKLSDTNLMRLNYFNKVANNGL